MERIKKVLQFDQIVKYILVAFTPNKSHIGSTLKVSSDTVSGETNIESLATAFVDKIEINYGQVLVDWTSEETSIPLTIIPFNDTDVNLTDLSANMLDMVPKCKWGWIVENAISKDITTNLFNTGASSLNLIIHKYKKDSVYRESVLLEVGDNYALDEIALTGLQIKCVPSNTDVHNKLVIR